MKLILYGEMIKLIIIYIFCHIIVIFFTDNFYIYLFQYLIFMELINTKHKRVLFNRHKYYKNKKTCTTNNIIKNIINVVYFYYIGK